MKKEGNSRLSTTYPEEEREEISTSGIIFPGMMAVDLPHLDVERLTTTARAFGWELVYSPISSRIVDADRRLFQTSNLQLATTRYNTGALVRGCIPKDAILLSSVPQASEIRCTFRGRPVTGNEIITYAGQSETDFSHDDACTVYSLAINKELFEEEFLNYFGVEFEEHIQHNPLGVDPDRLQAFVREINAWMNYGFTLSHHEIPLERYGKIEREILETLFGYIEFRREPGARERSLATLEKARRILHRNIGNDYTISELATALGMSKRNLQLLFKRHLGITPKRYSQIIRFQAIRSELLQAGDRERIGEIARKYGFSHMGHFSNEYKKIFGETPSQTLRSASKSIAF